MAVGDSTLAQRALIGDSKAFGDLVERYAGLVHGVILNLIRLPEEVEDLVQETFCRAYEQLPQLRNQSRFAPWLAQIARNTTLRWLQREGMRTHMEGANDDGCMESSTLPPDEIFEIQEQIALLWEALDQLPSEHRRLLVLYYLEGCTFREIARFLDQPLATIQGQLAQAERQLGQSLLSRLGVHQFWNDRTRKRLRQRVLAALPLAWWHPTPSRSLPRRNGKEWLQWTPPFFRQGIVVSLITSLLLHLLGVGLVKSFWEEPGEGIKTYLPLRETHRPFADGLLSPAPIFPQVELEYVRATADLPAPPPDLELKDSTFYRALSTPSLSSSISMLTPLQPFSLAPTQTRHPHFIPDLLHQLARIAIPDTLGSEELDLLRLEDWERAGVSHAALFPADTPIGVRGYIHLTPVRLYGAGSYTSPSNALADLARYLRDHTPIQAQIRGPEECEYFLASSLHAYPIHFLLEDGGIPAWSAQWLARISSEELEGLGDYLRGGGFLYVEGGKRWLREMISYVRQSLHAEGKLIPVPLSHPIYRAYYDCSGGFPGEYTKDVLDVPAPDWYYPADSYAGETQYPLGLWGAELDGELVALFSDLELLRGWELNPLPDETDRRQIPAKTPALRAATNVVVYALTRDHSLTIRKMQPLWEVLSYASASAYNPSRL